MKVNAPPNALLYCRECQRSHGFRLMDSHYVALMAQHVVPMPESVLHMYACQQRISIWTVMLTYSAVEDGGVAEVRLP